MKKTAAYSFGIVLSGNNNLDCVKKLYELSLEFVKIGHFVTIFTPNDSHPELQSFPGRHLPIRDLLLHEFDIVITSEYPLATTLLLCRSRLKIFYALSGDTRIRKIARFSEIEFFAENPMVYAYLKRITKKKPYQAYGGFHICERSALIENKEDLPFIICLKICNQSHLRDVLPVLRACEKLYNNGLNIKLLILLSEGNDVDPGSFKQYIGKIPCDFEKKSSERAHVYISIEKHDGWDKTIIDAMQSGTVVVSLHKCNKSLLLHNQTGIVVRPAVISIVSSLRRLYSDVSSRIKLTNAAKENLRLFSWATCAHGIVDYIENKFAGSNSNTIKSISLSHCIHHGHMIHHENQRFQSDFSLPPGIYCFCYHGVSSQFDRNEWEMSYKDVITDVDKFEQHISWLHKHAKPVNLSRISELLNNGVNEPFFSVTFDDGFRNIAQYAKPVLDTYGIRPTVFVNSAYSLDGAVFHRVLASMLIEKGFRKILVNAIEDLYGTRLKKRSNPLKAIKRDYRYGKTETAVVNAWKTQFNQLPENIYLSAADLKNLVHDGWEIGNHTHSHVKLSALTSGQQKFEIEECRRKISNAGIPMNSWVAYPYGSPTDINIDTLELISRNPECNGVFCHSGVNFFKTKSQWLRMGIANPSVEQFVQIIQDALYRTPCGTLGIK